MSKRQLVTVEMDPSAPDYGAMRGLDPNRATGIPIPAFRSGPTLPPAGIVEGEGFLVTTSRTGFVWSNGSWFPIAPSPVVTYPNEASLIADNTQPSGTYAAASDTGNLFIRSTSGWRMIGVRSYVNQTALQADSPAEGSIGLTLDDNVLWVRVGGKWRPETARIFLDLAGVLGWAPQDGAEAIETADGLSFIRAGGSWTPKSTWSVPLETTLLARTDMLAGQVAVAFDTGHRYVWSGTAWIGEPIRHYPTEAALLADKPADGTLAWGDDTSLVYARGGGLWKRVNSPGVIASDTQPAAPVKGDVWVKTDGTARTWNGSVWLFVGGAPIGHITMWPSFAMPPGYLVCDGSPIDPSVYPELVKWVGNNLPDLRGQFIRGARVQADVASGKHPHTTARPRNSSFTTNATGDHQHPETVAPYGGSGAKTWDGGTPNGNRTMTGAAGNHTHTITGGGDAETAPDHVYLVYIIRAL